MDLKDFKHKTTVTVRFHEVDMLGVCNNAVYINYFEHARLEYVKAAGLIPAGGIFSDGKLFFMVRNEINYLGHSFYDDELDVYSKVTYIKNSSFGYDHLIVRTKSGEVIVDGKGVVVFVDPKTRKSTPITEDIIEKIKTFEPDVKIIR
ncbi:MAG TPA: thioesterase family protein [Ignavibacteriaceae bacterium]|nr:thioesterase family protein [Ignavibacteriaceae bacterium]